MQPIHGIRDILQGVELWKIARKRYLDEDVLKLLRQKGLIDRNGLKFEIKGT